MIRWCCGYVVFGVEAVLVCLTEQSVPDEVSVCEAFASPVEGFEDQLRIVAGFEVDLDQLHVAHHRHDEGPHPFLWGVRQVVERVVLLAYLKPAGDLGLEEAQCSLGS